MIWCVQCGEQSHSPCPLVLRDIAYVSHLTMASGIVGDRENGVRSSEVIAMDVMGLLHKLDASTETLCQLAENPGPFQPHICRWMDDVQCHVFRTLVAAGVEVMHCMCVSIYSCTYTIPY